MSRNSPSIFFNDGENSLCVEQCKDIPEPSPRLVAAIKAAWAEFDRVYGRPTVEFGRLSDTDFDQDSILYGISPLKYTAARKREAQEERSAEWEREQAALANPSTTAEHVDQTKEGL